MTVLRVAVQTLIQVAVIQWTLLEVAEVTVTVGSVYFQFPLLRGEEIWI